MLLLSLSSSYRRSPVAGKCGEAMSPFSRSESVDTSGATSSDRLPPLVESPGYACHPHPASASGNVGSNTGNRYMGLWNGRLGICISELGMEYWESVYRNGIMYLYECLRQA